MYFEFSKRYFGTIPFHLETFWHYFSFCKKMKRRLLVVFFVILALNSYSQSCTLNVSITSPGTAICSGNSIVLTAKTAAGTAPYRYVWNTGETTDAISVSRAGTYTVTVTDNTPGCPGVVKSIAVTNSSTPPAPTVADAITCPNGNVVLVATAPGGIYQWYDAPVGGNLVNTGPQFTTPNLPANTTYYVETTVGQCTSPRKSVNVNIVSTLTVTGDIVCAGSTATISASGANSYLWYDAPVGGNVLGNQATLVTPVLNATTIFYVVASGNGCTTSRTPVTVAVQPRVVPPTASGVTICSGSVANLSATSSTPGVFFDWFDVPVGGTSLITSPTYTTPPLTTTTTYYVQGSALGCGNPRTAVTVTVDSQPAKPIANNITICAGNSATLSEPPTTGSYNWYNSPNSTSVLFTGNSYQTPVLNRSTIYYVETVNGACTSERTAVNVTVTTALASPSAAGQIICVGNSAQLKAISKSGSVEWYDAPIGGNLLSTNAVYITPGLFTNTSYYVQAVSSNCASPRVAVKVQVVAPTKAPKAPDVTVCAGNTATLVAAGAGGTYHWYSAPTGGTLLSSSQQFITPPLLATTTYYADNTAHGCTSPRTAVTVSVNPYPTPPVSSDVAICRDTKVTLQASGTGAIAWYDAPVGGNLLASTNNFTTPALSSKTTYYVDNTVLGCTSTRTAVTVTPSPASGFQYKSSTFCTSGTNPVPDLNNPNGGTFSADDSGLVFADVTTGEIDLASSTPGQYKVSFTSGGSCPTTTAQQITIVLIPDATFAYPSNEFCQNTTNPVPVYPGTPNPGLFTASPVGLVFTSPLSGQIDLLKSTPGTYTVTNTIAASTGCPTASYSISVTILSAPTTHAGPDQTVAAGSVVQLAGSFTGAPGMIWQGGLGTFSDPTSPTAVYTPAAGETIAALTLTTTNPPGICNDASTVNITISPNPGAPTAAGLTICSGSVATLTATAPGGSYEWYDAPTGGNLLATTAVYNTNTLIATTTFYVQTTVSGVTTARTPVIVTVSPPVSLPVVQPQTVCEGNPATLTATGSAGTYEWYDSLSGNNLLSTNSTFITPALNTSTTYYVQAIFNGCTSARIQVDVLVNPKPTITSQSTGIICNSTALNYVITADVPSAFVWSRNAVADISNAAVTNQTSATITENLINTGQAPVDVTYTITPVANGCTGDPFTLVITVYPPLVITSAKAETICNRTAVEYAVHFNYPPDSYTWSRAQVNGIINGPVTNQADGVIREVLSNNTLFPIDVHYTFTTNAGGCLGTTFDFVVTVNPSTFLKSATTNSLCSATQQNYTIVSNIDVTDYSWSRGATLNISNPPVTNQLSNTINETLINISSNPVQVVYNIIPLANPCALLKYTVTVNPYSPDPAPASNSPVCINSTIQLFTNIVRGATYNWTGPNGFTSGLQNPVIPNATKVNAGFYKLYINSNGCNSVLDSTEVFVDDPPQANAGLNQVVCKSEAAIKLDGKISGGTTTGIWSTSGTGQFTPFNNVLDGNYIPSAADVNSGSVTLTLTSTSKDDCNIATASMTVVFQQLTTADAGGDKDVCSTDVSVPLNGKATFNIGVLWSSSGSGTFSPSDKVAAPIYIPSALDIKNGAVGLTFVAFSAACSEVTDHATIRFVPPPEVNTGKLIYVLKGKPVNITPTVNEPNLQYKWTPATNLSNDTAKSPIFTGLRDMVYTLRVTDVRGCFSEDQLVVKVLNGFEIPNTFTPNGDGINDVWNIPGLAKYPDVTVDIFTRYGQKVFHCNGYGTPWDGTNNGQRLPVGVYYYIINTKFNDQKLSGYITLLR